MTRKLLKIGPQLFEKKERDAVDFEGGVLCGRWRRRKKDDWLLQKIFH